MKKYSTSLKTLLVALALVLALLPQRAEAAGASLSGNGTVQAGSTVTLTLSGIYYGHNAGTQGFGFRIGTSPTAWANARGETPDSTLGYMSYSDAAGYGCTMTAAGLNLRAYTTYYIFVYAATGGAEY